MNNWAEAPDAVATTATAINPRLVLDRAFSSVGHREFGVDAIAPAKGEPKFLAKRPRTIRNSSNCPVTPRLVMKLVSGSSTRPESMSSTHRFEWS